MTVGENIKEIRKEKGLTQKQLGDKCNINEANLRKYENGKQTPKIETIKKIADALEVPCTRLLPTISTNDERSKLSEMQGVILNRIAYLTSDWDSALKKADYIKAHDDQILLTELNMILKLLK